MGLGRLFESMTSPFVKKMRKGYGETYPGIDVANVSDFGYTSASLGEAVSKWKQDTASMLGEASSLRRSRLRRGLSYNMFSSLAGTGLGGTMGGQMATSAGLKTLLGE